MDKINLKVGEIYQIKLEGYANVGYSWMHIIEESTGVLNISKEAIPVLSRPHSGSSPPDAVNKDQLYTFVAIKPGILRIRLILCRLWEKDEPPLKEIQLEFSISKKSEERNSGDRVNPKVMTP